MALKLTSVKGAKKDPLNVLTNAHKEVIVALTWPNGMLVNILGDVNEKALTTEQRVLVMQISADIRAGERLVLSGLERLEVLLADLLKKEETGE